MRKIVVRTPFYYILIFAILIGINGVVAALEPSESVKNEAAYDGFIDLKMAINPAIVRPGEEMELTLTATNRGMIDAPIVFEGIVPANVSFEISQLQASTTFNLRTNSFIWQPVIPAGESLSFSLPLRAGAADMSQPIQKVVGKYQYGQISQENSAEMWIGVLPSAKILGVEQVSVGQQLKLTAAVEGPGPFSQTWDLGDGREFNAENPTVSFANVGVYTVELSVNNPLGKTTATKIINVIPDPIALFSLDDPTPTVGQEISFLNESGGAGDLDYYWDFGDGQSALVRQPQHKYKDAGIYQIKLVVSSDFGESETTLPLEIGLPPSLDMNLSEEAKTGEIVNGFAFSNDDQAEFVWEMGDGATISGTQLAHIYAEPGKYLVQLTASNNFGRTQQTKSIVVQQGESYVFLPIIYKSVPANVQTIEQVPSAELSQQVPSNDSAAIILSADNSGQPQYVSGFQPIDLNASSVPFNSTQEQRLLWYINKARLAEGLTPYRYNEALSQAAQRHTNDMAFNNFWGHDGSDGSVPEQRQDAAGYTGSYGGEATAWGFEYPSGAVRYWLESPGHRPIILNPNADEVGIAFTYHEDSSSIYYWTAEFGREDGSYAYPFFDYVPPPKPTPPPVATSIIPAATPSATITPTQEADIVVVTPTAEVVVSAEPEPTATATPTATPQATPTPAAPEVIVETATPAPTEPPATATPSPTSQPTATIEPTATPQPTATSIPTAVPTPTEPVIIATATPQPTATPADDAEADEGRDAVIATLTPLPTDDGISADVDNAEAAAAVAELFFDALIRDPRGFEALPFATYALQNQLLDAGVQTTLAIDADLVSFQLDQPQAKGTTFSISAELTDGTSQSHTRILTMAFAENQWRVASITSP